MYVKPIGFSLGFGWLGYSERIFNISYGPLGHRNAYGSGTQDELLLFNRLRSRI